VSVCVGNNLDPLHGCSRSHLVAYWEGGSRAILRSIMIVAVVYSGYYGDSQLLRLVGFHGRLGLECLESW
jgi:hypothetical protein